MTREEVDRVIIVMEAHLATVPSLCLHSGCAVVTAGYCVAHAPERERF